MTRARNRKTKTRAKIETVTNPSSSISFHSPLRLTQRLSFLGGAQAAQSLLYRLVLFLAYQRCMLQIPPFSSSA